MRKRTNPPGLDNAVVSIDGVLSFTFERLCVRVLETLCEQLLSLTDFIARLI